MSTEGAGKACLAAGSPLVVGLRAGVLAADGLMWVGANALAGLKAWSDKGNQERAKDVKSMEKHQRSIQESLSPFLRSQLEAMAIAQMYREVIPSRRSYENEQAALRQAMASAQAALAEVNPSLKLSPAELARRKAQQELKSELIAGRSTLPPALLQQGVEALDTSAEIIVPLVERLRKVRQGEEGKMSWQQQQRREFDDTHHLTSGQLDGINQWLEELGSEQRVRFLEQRDAIRQLLSEASIQARSDLAAALHRVAEAGQSVGTLADAVSSELLETRLTVNSQINEQLGVLDALASMLAGVNRLDAPDRPILLRLAERVRELSEEIQQLTGEGLVRARQRLATSIQRISSLREEIFDVVEKFQQRFVAGTIAETVFELGFNLATGEQGPLQENGETLRVVATPVSQPMRRRKSQEDIPVQTKRDDRIISFEISRDGDIAYDFIGYTGNACVEDAERIFAALRAKGLYILEPAAAQRMQEAQAQGRRISPQMLNRPEVQAQPTKNKMQAELVERLRAVLASMQYENVAQQVVGGCVEIDAFNGDMGYHAIVMPEGGLKLSKDDGIQEVNIALDSTDPLAIESRKVKGQKKEQSEQASTTPKPRRTTPHQAEREKQGY